MKTQPTFREAFEFWLKLGFISFGGPAGQIAIMHEYLVEKKKWISESKFLHALSFCMILPGPEAQQLATYIGWLMHGKKGGLTAGILFVLPSMFILLGLSVIYLRYGNIPWVLAIFNGLKPAVIAIVVLALIKIARKSIKNIFHLLIAFSAFIGIFFFNISFPVIIISALLVAAIVRYFFTHLFIKRTKEVDANSKDEENYFINAHTKSTYMELHPKEIIRDLFLAVVFWIFPLLLFRMLINDFQFWKTLVLFFTKAAFFTFGGAYAVLPYVAQVSVEKLKWLTDLQMIDGLALGETTPGPLIMVLAFVGFMAGSGHYQNSITMGALGLVTTTFYTFLPSFVFIFIGAPFIEKTQENKSIRQILEIVTAAVVGVVLNLTLYLSKAVLFASKQMTMEVDFISLAWIIISFIAMYRYKLNMILWIAISALFGLFLYLIN